MSYYQFRLTAGMPFQAPIGGKVILVDSTGEAEGIDIMPMRGGQEMRRMPKRQKAFKHWIDYDAIVLQAAVDCTVALFLSHTDVSLGFADGANVNVRGAVTIENDPDNRVSVDVGDSITLTAENVGINNDNAGAVPVKNQALNMIVQPAPVAVGLAAVSVSNDATLRRLRIRNASATAVIALGGAGVTLANSPIQLQPGDAYIEGDAAGAPWFAIADEAGASVQVQGVK